MSEDTKEALRKELASRERRIAELHRQLNGLRSENANLKERIARLVSMLDEQGRGT